MRVTVLKEEPSADIKIEVNGKAIVAEGEEPKKE